MNEWEVDKCKAVNLTTDIRPVGHGLPDGREISDDETIFFWSIQRIITVSQLLNGFAFGKFHAILNLRIWSVIRIDRAP